MMVAACLAVIKAGGVAVATMPLLRAREIAYPIEQGEDRARALRHRLADEMERRRRSRPDLQRVVYWGGGAPTASKR